MNADIGKGWSLVIHHPLFGLGMTLLAFQIALKINQRTGLVFLQPVLVSGALIVCMLYALGIDYAEYRDSVSMISVLLGPATVALAVPLYQNLKRIRQLFWPILLTLSIGGTFTTVIALLLGEVFGVDHSMLMTLAPKSVTSPIAMLVAEQVGGVAALAAVFVLITGIIGAVVGPFLLRRLRIDHPAAVGMALGLTAHAVGTARALQEGRETGAFAALAMSLMGVSTAVLLPMVINFFG
ncbi:LrgB family protein [Pseudomonas sp. LFM046]|uniref:LrgB family protein n=1 Tax=Pseudomonas sp. LFM046 TaxID=1608357 RepID=UPI0005CFDDC6|nr:LrgB family protein [Pseudomonas sp. LFM046]